MALGNASHDSPQTDEQGSGSALCILCAIVLFYLGISLIGITWGLPSRNIDKFLFGGGEVWNGEKIYRLAKADEKLSPDRARRIGADVDVDPINTGPRSSRSPRPSPLQGDAGAARPNSGTDESIALTATDEDIARILLRYRLYTYQPDEMITMMALAGMHPSRLELDPRLYQYGGLFIYPVGALIRLCGLLGWIDVRNDVVYYLDHPDAFGKFYIVARAYSAAWGVLGILLVFAIARRLSRRAAPESQGDPGDPDAGAGRPSPNDSRQSHAPLPHGRGSDESARAGLLAAALFALMPVVVCMSHEGKPHLPGAVLMLAAVYIAMRCVGDRATHAKVAARVNRRTFLLLCVCCGAAVGMVLSSWPIFVLIPLVAWIQANPPLSLLGRGGGDASVRGELEGRISAVVARAVPGFLLAVAVYLICNPYVLINVFVNRDVLRSNFGNSLAMYQLARVAEGFVRVVELTVEGATLPILVLGILALVGVFVRTNPRNDPTIWVLVAPAAVFFSQFVAIGAGKPAEYGRFGIFPDAALAIGTACLLNARLLRKHWFLRLAFPALVIAWVAALGGGYLRNFHTDTTERGSRITLARQIAERGANATDIDTQPMVIVSAEPAPYCCPPLHFTSCDVRLWRSSEPLASFHSQQHWISVRTSDAGATRVSDVAGLLLRKLGIWEGLERPTPMSWANKPFQVIASDDSTPRD